LRETIAMRCRVRLLVLPALVAVVSTATADARVIGGGTGLSVRIGPFANGFHHGFPPRPGFARNPRAAPFAQHLLHRHQFPRPVQTAFPWWWAGVWPGDWGPGYAYQPAQPTEAPPSQPQIVVIQGDGTEHMTRAETTPDYSYVPGCHAIANGYHCDPPGETHQ
jgi:hypothetical protein